MRDFSAGEWYQSGVKGMKVSRSWKKEEAEAGGRVYRQWVVVVCRDIDIRVVYKSARTICKKVY
jgi:hypothetical protein